jgi:hypothetical protein
MEWKEWNALNALSEARARECQKNKHTHNVTSQRLNDATQRRNDATIACAKMSTACNESTREVRARMREYAAYPFWSTLSSDALSRWGNERTSLTFEHDVVRAFVELCERSAARQRFASSVSHPAFREI